MELTTAQLAILAGLTAAQLGGLAVTYWVGRSLGQRRGNASGYQTGYQLASERLQAEMNETTARCNSAERLLAATQAELRQAKDQHSRSLQDAREAYEALHLQLDDAQVLNDGHARLLRDAADNLRLAHATWLSLHAERKAGEAQALAAQLRDLAGWLQPQSATDDLERAA